MRSANIEIHTDALEHNLSVIKSTLQPNTRVLAMVKANAYGHGVESAVPALLAADGFGVACMQEALQVWQSLQSVQANSTKSIVLIEGVFSQEEWQIALDKQFECIIHQPSQLQYALAQKPQTDSRTNTIWLKHNTGMNRLGFDDVTVVQVAKQLVDAGYRLVLTTHFACADDKAHPLNQQQISRFNQALAHIRAFAPETQASICNSAGIFNFPTEHHQWVRAGIALYGSKAICDKSAKQLNLQPAMTLSAQLMATHTLHAGDSVGYAALWQAQQSCKIGIVSIGYGDGYPRVLTGSQVCIINKRGQQHLCAIIGRVAMDMLMVNIDDCDVQVGDTVILWGQAPHIDDVAACANTIGYELMCRLTTRPTRQAATNANK